MGRPTETALVLLAIQTVLRVSEPTSLHSDDITFGDGSSARCLGKAEAGAVPLTTTTQAVPRT